jgi:transcription elongation factor
MSIEELNPNAIRIIPPEDFMSVLYVKNPFSFDSMNWARLTGRGPGWTRYKSDVAMVVQHEGVKTLVIIPRIKTSQSITSKRIQQSLYPAHVLQNIFGDSCISSVSPNGSFSFQERRYTKEGFLYQDISEVDVFRPEDDLPNIAELEIFKECSLMDKKVLSYTTSCLSQQRITFDTHVVVVDGDFHGLVGRVVEVGVNEVAVHVESQDHVEQVNLSSVRVAFRIGDQVRINRGPHLGRTGWIVDVHHLSVTVINVDQCLEVRYINSNHHIINKDKQASIKKTDIEFYNSPFITTLRKRSAANDIKFGQDDPNKIYHGKRVIIVGGNRYKGYKGIIKHTNLKGYAWVELEARLQQLEKISLNCLAIL